MHGLYDYKIISKAFALRMKPMLEKIIHVDQKGFLQGRFIGCSIPKMLDIIDYADQQGLETMIVSVDFEKAFDRIEYSAIEGALRYFNFGDNFTEWFKLLYKSFQLSVCNSGSILEWFYPSRGLHQGYGASSRIFLVCAELIATAIRNDSRIEGITIGNVENKLSQFADDMDLYLLYKKDRVPTFLQPQNSRIFPGFFKEFDAIFQVYFCIGS